MNGHDGIEENIVVSAFYCCGLQVFLIIFVNYFTPNEKQCELHISVFEPCIGECLVFILCALNQCVKQVFRQYSLQSLQD